MVTISATNIITYAQLSTISFPFQFAEGMFREHTRKLVEENISRAVTILKSRTRAPYGYNYL